MRILFLSRQASAVAYYRQTLLARQCIKLGHQVTHFNGRTFFDACIPSKAGQRRSPRELWHGEWLYERDGEFDLIVVDRALTHVDVGIFSGYIVRNEARMIVDIDDDIRNVPQWNPAYAKYHPGQEFLEAGLGHLRLSQCLTVSTPALARAYTQMAHRVRVQPNLIDPADWEGHPTNPERSADPHLRILYGGAAGHYGDLESIREGLEPVLRKPPVPLRLICFGATPNWVHDIGQEFPGRVIVLPWVPFPDYAAAVAWGGFDFAIAPLASHVFNHSKSNIKWLEATLQGIPLLVSNIGPYSEIPNGAAVKATTPADWAAALHELLRNKTLRKQTLKAANECVRDEWTLDHGLQRTQILLEEAASWPLIRSLADAQLPSASALETLIASSEGGTAETA